MTANERQIFNQLLYPDDSYNEHGVYWADLPLAQKVKFVSSYDAKESKREIGNIWRMFKADPLSPVAYYFRNMVLPGAGLGLEGFVWALIPSLSLSLAPFLLFLSFSFSFFFFKKMGWDLYCSTPDMCSSPSVT